MTSFERERSYSRSRTASPARQNHKNDRTDNIPKGPRINHNDNGRGKGHGRGRSGWRGRGRERKKTGIMQGEMEATNLEMI
ncbi:hypothetical protein JL09_g6504 [Pichia kudriavzevii]|uniref:Uncharacterized protein n=1 Tax=Pichia kudriavzevii TaxID=4909 RepID=A0A099NQM1_PICKU|nr:hypothetical protein JL09_g6504 [Pichia kudriavzevii]